MKSVWPQLLPRDNSTWRYSPTHRWGHPWRVCRLFCGRRTTCRTRVASLRAQPNRRFFRCRRKDCEWSICFIGRSTPACCSLWNRAATVAKISLSGTKSATKPASSADLNSTPIHTRLELATWWLVTFLKISFGASMRLMGYACTKMEF